MTDIASDTTDPQSLFVKASKLHDAGKYREAQHLFSSLLKTFPHLWQIHFSLAQVLFAMGDAQQAEHHYTKALKIEKESGDIYYNLAICQKSLGKIEQAIKSYHQALTLDSRDLESRYNLAGCYAQLNDTEAAIHHYHELLKRQADHKSALSNLAYLYQRENQDLEALHIYRKLLAVDPENSSAKHMVSALKSEPISRTPDAYIRELFDNYASNYEQSLVQNLSYNLPAVMYAFHAEEPAPPTFLKTVDLGCGTGLSGLAFGHVSQTMIGVDLSERMIAIAQQKQVYDEFMVCDILSAFSESRLHNADLLLALDVFGYVGDLQEVLKSAWTISSPDALFYFSVESLATGDAFLLKRSGRFSHSYRYVERQARNSGWQVARSRQINLRKERGRWVHGTIFKLTKSSVEDLTSLPEPTEQKTDNH